jgi:hypothetical protein
MPHIPSATFLLTKANQWLRFRNWHLWEAVPPPHRRKPGNFSKKFGKHLVDQRKLVHGFNEQRLLVILKQYVFSQKRFRDMVIRIL